MTRQQALNQIWQRLLIVFVSLFALLVVLYYLGGDARVPIYVFIAGNVGAYVGVHRSLGDLKDPELVDLAGSWLGIVVPSFVGGILAFVLYNLFISEIVSGQLFPAFERDAGAVVRQSIDMLTTQHLRQPQDYAKLFFWSFVAGFNQKYVVDIISSIKGKP